MIPYLSNAPVVRRSQLVLFTGALLIAPRVEAQTDYFNTDRGRPLHVQDARALERYAFEIQVAPMHWSRGGSGRDVWRFEPGIAYGILPRTQVGIGLEMSYVPAINGLRQITSTSLHLAALHALNTETLSIPALALSAEVGVPFGTFTSRRVFPVIGVAMTRTLSAVRVHANVDVGVAEEVPSTPDDCTPVDPLTPHDESRWLVGVAVDKALPLRSVLIAAELTARQPIISGSDLEWRAGGGMRWQVNPYWTFDAGLARSFGTTREWSATFGAARAFSLFRLTPGGTR